MSEINWDEIQEFAKAAGRAVRRSRLELVERVIDGYGAEMSTEEREAAIEKLMKCSPIHVVGVS